MKKKVMNVMSLYVYMYMYIYLETPSIRRSLGRRSIMNVTPGRFHEIEQANNAVCFLSFF